MYLIRIISSIRNLLACFTWNIYEGRPVPFHSFICSLQANFIHSSSSRLHKELQISIYHLGHSTNQSVKTFLLLLGVSSCGSQPQIATWWFLLQSRASNPSSFSLQTPTPNWAGQTNDRMYVHLCVLRRCKARRTIVPERFCDLLRYLITLEEIQQADVSAYNCSSLLPLIFDSFRLEAMKGMALGSLDFSFQSFKIWNIQENGTRHTSN